MPSVLCPALLALLAMLTPMARRLVAPRLAAPLLAPRVAPMAGCPTNGCPRLAWTGLTVVGRGLGPKLVWLPLLLLLILLSPRCCCCRGWLRSMASAPIANFDTCAWQSYTYVAKSQRRL